MKHIQSSDLNYHSSGV